MNITKEIEVLREKVNSHDKIVESLNKQSELFKESCKQVSNEISKESCPESAKVLCKDLCKDLCTELTKLYEESCTNTEIKTPTYWEKYHANQRQLRKENFKKLILPYFNFEKSFCNEIPESLLNNDENNMFLEEIIKSLNQCSIKKEYKFYNRFNHALNKYVYQIKLENKSESADLIYIFVLVIFVFVVCIIITTKPKI
jgi:hypothetical protein